MRFSRRNKGPLAWARRTKSRGQDCESEQEFGPVASEERHALLSSNSSSEGGSPDLSDHEEATQHMLSALGRFHRQVAKAKVGAGQTMWTDECMSELVAAADVAVREGWRETVEVLTETGRVLQTYEDAGRAGECISFLSEVYDILSLMVGDLIVGEVRPGVLEKWQDCYAKAVDTVQAAGLSLIQDEEGDGEVDRVARADAESGSPASQPINTVPFELPPLDDDDEEYADGPGDAPTLDNLPPIADTAAVGAEPIDETLLAQEQSREYAGEADASEPDPVEAAVASLTGGGAVMGGALSEADDEEDAAELSGSRETADPPDKSEHAEAFEDPEMVATLDSFCEGLAKIEQSGERDFTTVYAAMLDGLAFLDQWTVEADAGQAQKLSHAMALLCQRVAEGLATPNDKFLELGYGFCEAFVEAMSSEPGPAVGVWLEECSSLYRQWTDETESLESAALLTDASAGGEGSAAAVSLDALDAEPEAFEEAATPAAAPTENDGSPESLLRIAQEAVAAGRANEAKVLAMQAAAAFAQREAEQAQQRLSDIERRINEGGMQIEAARTELRGAEEAVTQAENGTRDSEGAVSACGKETLATRERLDAADAEIEALDAQIRELQAQRDAAAEQRAGIDGELTQRRDDEANAEAALAAQRDQEDAARNQLEEARQRVKNLERKRVELELEMEHARDYLARHQSSLEDIQQTIAQLRNNDAADSGDSDELLF